MIPAIVATTPSTIPMISPVVKPWLPLLRSAWLGRVDAVEEELVELGGEVVLEENVVVGPLPWEEGVLSTVVGEGAVSLFGRGELEGVEVVAADEVVLAPAPTRHALSASASRASRRRELQPWPSTTPAQR